jgi:microcompartment protein CcmL/EutN
MGRSALGFLEVQGYSVALAAADKACKAADVRIEGIDCNNPDASVKSTIPLMVQVKFSGEVSDVRHALEVARETARAYLSDREILTHCIPRGGEGIEALLPIGKVTRK